MFGFARRARAEASRSFIGKLPWSAEFVRVNAGSAEARQLDDWFQAGLALAAEARQDWEAQFDALPTTLYWCNFAGSERTLIGALRAGRDASGRRYPVSAFAAFDARNLEHALAISPLAFDASLHGAAGLVDAAADAGAIDLVSLSLAELPTLAAADDPLHRQELWKFLDTHTVEDLAGMCGLAMRGLARERGLDRIAAALAEVLMPLRTTSPRRLTWALVLPISGDPALRDLVAGFWLDLVDALLGRRAIRASYFIAGARLVLTFRDPSPRIFAGLIAGPWDGETILDLTAVEPPASYSYAGRTLLETAASADAPAARLVRAAESL